MASERLKMRRLEDGLAFYIRNQLTDQPILTDQELYKRAAKVERVKGELRALNTGNQKRKPNDCGTSSESIAWKKHAIGLGKSCAVALTAPCANWGRTNHTITECCVGPKNCMSCGSTNHSVATCSRRQKTAEKGVARPLPLPRHGTLPTKVAMTGRAYVMNKKEAIISGTIVT